MKQSSYEQKYTSSKTGIWGLKEKEKNIREKTKE